MSTERKNSPVLLEVSDLTVAYGAITAVKNLNLTVREGEIVTLIGSNGAGKSTLLKIMVGIDKDFTGEAWAAEGAKVGCPVSQALAAVPISLSVEFVA